MNALGKIRRRCLTAGVLSCSVLGVFASSASGLDGPSVLTFKELEKGATVQFVDSPPQATLRHGVVFFSPGDELISTNPLAIDGRLVGRIRVICTATTKGNSARPSSSGFICNGIAKLPGGSLILVGEAGEGITEGSVIGGTGIYAGARGTITSKPGRGGATSTVTLLE